ncbi:hypothetical protein AWR36_007605 [Microbulbifer flavimaris]|uniref:Uncharacterized protein n=1 Tax=Microbulbifer flavimaris TaxID=1781068 RepID=A0ABX4I1R4_9GAMM|nr:MULTISPECIES: hypothetical protein [Microbulbifer]KUJ83691.1 hypothetical protein AVO43_07580 [Microbulbifer sp. ZGT114]PCO05860.1 hypothetical protein AWR36_007605 [Microbulbifer flavimaris]
MTSIDCLGAAKPQLVLYLPHRPNALAELIKSPGSRELMDANSNHWRKIVTLLAKVASPNADDWRRFRDEDLFAHTALCFAPALTAGDSWHWIGGQQNLKRFNHLSHNAQPLPDCACVHVDAEKRLLLTPYPDYRQLSNAVVNHIRTFLGERSFYGN